MRNAKARTRRREEGEGGKEEERGATSLQNEDPTPQDGWEKTTTNKEKNTTTTTTTIILRLFAPICPRVIHYAYPKPWIPALFVFDRTPLGGVIFLPGHVQLEKRGRRTRNQRQRALALVGETPFHLSQADISGNPH